MSASLFKITPTPPTSIQVEPGQEGKLSPSRRRLRSEPQRDASP